MAETTIEWTRGPKGEKGYTFNPWEGCQKVSPGCDRCYAEARNARFGGGQALNWGPAAPRRRTSDANWRLPLKWNAEAQRLGIRYRVFCASLADVFDNHVPEQWRTDLFELIRLTPNLDWLLLTKRPQNIVRMVQVSGAFAGNGMRFLPENVWLGTTAEDQARADQNINALLRTRSELGARVLFLSAEPLLGPLDLVPYIHCDVANTLDWVIVGGESGHHARPMHPDWARSLRDQCQAAGVPFFFKQWGEWKPINQMEGAEHERLYASKVKAEPHEDQGNLDDIYGRRCTVDTTVTHHDGSTHSITEPMAFLQGTEAMMAFKVGKKAAGRLLDGRTWDEAPHG